jgi:hypothetical protein
MARGLPPGALPVRVTHAGFEPVIGSVVVQAGELAEVAVTLDPLALDPIVVTARRRGMLTDVHWRANNHIGGIYLMADEIRARAPSRVSDVVRAQPSVHITSSGSGRTGQIELRGGCAPHVWLDGVRITLDAPLVRDENPNARPMPTRREPWALEDAYAALNMVHPSSIEVIEIFRGPSELPAEFGGSLGGCGAIAIWTTRGGSAGR